MKRLLKLSAVLAALAAVGPRWGFAATRVDGTNIFSETALTYSTTSASINTDGINTLSMQAVYSTATLAAVTITDGRKSTATITVADNNALVAKAAGFTVRVASNNITGGTTLTIATPLSSYKFKSGAGGNWSYVDTSSGSCQALATAINADPSGLFVASCPFVVGGGTVCFSSAAVAGSSANSWTISSSSPPALSTGNVVFSGGLDDARLVISSVSLIQGIDWTRTDTASGTCKAISDTIMARSGLNSVIIATWTPTGVLVATSTFVGVNAFTILTSTPNALKANGSATVATATFVNGAASDMASSIITKNNTFALGLAVLFSSGTAGTQPQNLTGQTTYYVVRVDATNFKLATSSANALANTTITVSTFTGGGSFTLTPLALTTQANNGFKFQVSNDNSNWFDLAVSSVTLTSSSNSNTFWDLGTPAYRWIRALFVPPVTGAYAVTISANGRQN